MTPEQIQLFINAAGSPAAIALGSSPTIIKVFGCIHEYIGIWWGPHQILREAKAQAYADATTQLIKQSLDANATEDERLLARGLMAKEKTIIREQGNKESIVLKALPEVKDDAKPEEVEDDWYANFFDKSRLVSDEEMQMLWAKVLAGEVNQPGTFSRRGLNLLSYLDRKDAQKFINLCRFSETSKGYAHLPLIYKYVDDIYKDANLTFSDLNNLQSIGLISFSEFAYRNKGSNNRLNIQYSSYLFELELQGPSWKADFELGHVMLTDLGDELARLCQPELVVGFEDYLIAKWLELGYKVTIYREGEALREA